MTQFWTRERPRILVLRKTWRQLLVADLGQRRVHHQDQADGDGDRGRADRQARDGPHDAGSDVAQQDAEGHRQEDPERQVAVEEGEPPGLAGWQAIGLGP